MAFHRFAKLVRGRRERRPRPAQRRGGTAAKEALGFLASLFLTACVSAPASTPDGGSIDQFAARVTAATDGAGSVQLAACVDGTFTGCGDGVDVSIDGDWVPVRSQSIEASPGDTIWTRYASPDGTPMAKLRIARAIDAITADASGGIVHATWGAPDPEARVNLDVSLDCGTPGATTLQLTDDPGACTIDLAALGFTVGTDCDAQLTVHRIIDDDAIAQSAELLATSDYAVLGPHFTVSR